MVLESAFSFLDRPFIDRFLVVTIAAAHHVHDHDALPAQVGVGNFEVFDDFFPRLEDPE